MNESARILGIIGGSGLYALEELEDVEELAITTPFGEPSDRIVSGRIGKTRLLFLPRHGRSHHLPPHRINYRANILALKIAGAEQVLSISAVGSMKEHIEPGDLVVVDQFIDRTRNRSDTFFEDDGVVAHAEFAEPIDTQLADALEQAARTTGAKVHRGGTYVCIEGPQFSTRAESLLYRSWGATVVGMTNLPEARLAREAELPYATLAMATDFDCWHQAHAAVTVEGVLKVMAKNVANAKRAIVELAKHAPDPTGRPATSAMNGAIMSNLSTLSAETRAKFEPLIGRYLGKGS